MQAQLRAIELLLRCQVWADLDRWQALNLQQRAGFGER
jgi:hypothetical protein